MPFRDSPDQNPSKIPIRNPDGTVNIHCKKCGYFICRTTYTGYSSAICHYCDTGTIRPEIANPQEELLREIFGSPDANLTVEQLAKPKTKFNILDMVVNTVRALGFGRKVNEPIDEEQVKYQTADQETSKQVARRKQREPIFGKKRKKDE